MTRLSAEPIIDCLRQNYGLEVTSLTLLPIGADMNAAVYRAQIASGLSYFVKLKWGPHPDISATLLALLQEVGIQAIIPPIQTAQGRATQALDDCTLIVYPFVEGQDGFSRPLSEDNWFTLGRLLRQIHELKLPPAVQKEIRREAYAPQWREAARSLLSQRVGSSDEIGSRLAAFMKEHRRAIDRLVERAEALVPKQLSEYVLCHSDIHGGNVLIDNKGTIYVVDWDEPIMAPKERDLMFVGGGVANVWNRPEEEEFFYKGYGKTHIDRAILAYYRHERIVEDIALYGERLLLSSEGGREREVMYDQFVAMFEPQGVVEIAFKTDCA